MIKRKPIYCGICGRLRVLPLFLIVEQCDAFAVCHDHVDGIIGVNGAAKTLGPWEAQLSGDTWLVKVRR